MVDGKSGAGNPSKTYPWDAKGAASDPLPGNSSEMSYIGIGKGDDPHSEWTPSTGVGNPQFPSCVQHADCPSGVCDRFGGFAEKIIGVSKNQCAPESNVCYVNVKAPCPGKGKKAQPYCKIQQCLDEPAPKLYVAISDGVYQENLTIASRVQLVAVGSLGPVLGPGETVQASQLKAKIVGQFDNQNRAVIHLQSNDTVIFNGLEITSSSLNRFGDLVSIETQGSTAFFKNCFFNGNSDVRGIYLYSGDPNYVQKVIVEDVVVSMCGKGIEAINTQLILHHVLLTGQADVAVEHSDEYLKLRNVMIHSNAGQGMQTYGSTLDIDRTSITQNLGTGARFDNSTSGTVSNLLIANNGKNQSGMNAATGLSLEHNSRPVFFNVTIADNQGLEVTCDKQTSLFNSIIWDDDAAIHAGPCIFLSSHVKGIQKSPPRFNESHPLHPYSLLPDSPCIDMGQSLILEANVDETTFPKLDLAGNPRMVKKKPSNPQTVDLGAYEVQ